MESIDVMRDKGIKAVGNLAGKAFYAEKDKMMAMVRKKPPMLSSTTVMLAKINKAINSAVKKKKTSVVGCFGGSVADEGFAGNI